MILVRLLYCFNGNYSIYIGPKEIEYVGIDNYKLYIIIHNNGNYSVYIYIGA